MKRVLIMLIFVNQKPLHYINVLVICNSDIKLRNTVPKLSGSTWSAHFKFHVPHQYLLTAVYNRASPIINMLKFEGKNVGLLQTVTFALYGQQVMLFFLSGPFVQPMQLLQQKFVPIQHFFRFNYITKLVWHLIQKCKMLQKCTKIQNTW